MIYKWKCDKRSKSKLPILWQIRIYGDLFLKTFCHCLQDKLTNVLYKLTCKLVLWYDRPHKNVSVRPIFSSKPKSCIYRLSHSLRLCVMFTHAGDSMSHAQVTFSHACLRSLLQILFHFSRKVFLVLCFLMQVVILCLTYRSHIWCSWAPPAYCE